MNTLARSLVDRLLIKLLHRNKNNNDIDDVEALVYLNEATREVFRWFALYLPSHIRKTYTYKTVEGESFVDLPSPVTRVFRLYVNGNEFTHSSDLMPYGTERSYRLDGFGRVVFDNFRTRNLDNIIIEYIPAELEEIIIPTDQRPMRPGESTDRSLFPQVLDDILISHCMISYEAARGMLQSPEEAIRGRWMQQIMAMFSDAIQPTSIGEYYQGYAPRGDML
jgi:hypothetical protein